MVADSLNFSTGLYIYALFSSLEKMAAIPKIANNIASFIKRV